MMISTFFGEKVINSSSRFKTYRYDGLFYFILSCASLLTVHFLSFGQVSLIYVATILDFNIRLFGVKERKREG